MESSTSSSCRCRVISSDRAGVVGRIAAAIWLAGSGTMVAADAMAAAQAPVAAQAVLHADQTGPTIAPEIYGQFSEHLGRGIYEGIWVGEDSAIANTRGFRNDVIAALRHIHVPVVRWPGGCFADEYHWRQGIGARTERPVRVNTNWGGVEENNAFGTQEYFDFLGLIGARSYVTMNLGTGTPQELADWVEYITSPSRSTLAQERRKNGHDAPWKLDYVGLGNESWGCGGNMRPEYYADMLRHYSTFVRPPAGQTANRVAVGPNADDYHWTEVLMANAAGSYDALALHYYTLPGGDWLHKGSAREFTEGDWIRTLAATLRMDELLTKHEAIMDHYDPARRVALDVDEWGLWHDVEPGSNPGFLYQQNTLRDALAAALNLNIFHRHAARVRMANIAQMVNVLQAMVLTQGDKLVLTPTYHVYDMYQAFQGATLLPLELDAPPYLHDGHSIPSVDASAARDAAGVIHLAIVNLDPGHAATLTVKIAGAQPHGVSGRVLTAPAMNAFNSFTAPTAVQPVAFGGAAVHSGVLIVSLPAKSVVVLDLN